MASSADTEVTEEKDAVLRLCLLEELQREQDTRMPGISGKKPEIGLELQISIQRNNCRAVRISG